MVLFPNRPDIRHVTVKVYVVQLKESQTFGASKTHEGQLQSNLVQLDDLAIPDVPGSSATDPALWLRDPLGLTQANRHPPLSSGQAGVRLEETLYGFHSNSALSKGSPN